MLRNVTLFCRFRSPLRKPGVQRWSASNPLLLKSQRARLELRKLSVEAKNAEQGMSKLEHVCSRVRNHVGANRLSYIVHAANVVALVAVTCDNMLELRLLMIAASSLGIVYNMLQPKPLLVPAAWGLVFIASHSYRIYIILQESATVEFSTEEEQLYETAFMPYGFSPRSFKDILRKSHARFEEYEAGEHIVCQNWGVQYNYYVMKGRVNILRNGRPINRISTDNKSARGEWIGQPWDRDYNFNENRWWRVTAEAEEKSTVVRFNLKGFHAAIREDESRMIAADRLQIKDLWGKLKHTTSLHRDLHNQKKQKIHSLKTLLETQIIEAYTAMIQVALSDGKLTESEIEELEAYRKKHNISDKDHQDILMQLNWPSPLLVGSIASHDGGDENDDNEEGDRVETPLSEMKQPNNPSSKHGNSLDNANSKALARSHN